MNQQLVILTAEGLCRMAPNTTITMTKIRPGDIDNLDDYTFNVESAFYERTFMNGSTLVLALS